MKFKNKIALILASAAMVLPLAFGGLSESNAHAQGLYPATYYTNGKRYGSYYAWIPNQNSSRENYTFGRFPSSFSKKGIPIVLFKGTDPSPSDTDTNGKRFKYSSSYRNIIRRHGHIYYECPIYSPNAGSPNNPKIGGKDIYSIYIDNRDIGKRASNKNQFSRKIAAEINRAGSKVRYAPFKQRKRVRKHYRRLRIHRKRARCHNVKRNRAKRTVKRRSHTRRK